MSAALQLLETAHRLGQRHSAAPMQQVEVDLLKLQAAQAGFARGLQPAHAGVFG